MFILLISKNGRCIIDTIERLVRKVSTTAATFYAPAKIVNELAQLTLNDESTCGYKQHILENEDDGRYVDIYLHPYSNNGIEFKTPSGISTTDYALRTSQIRHDEH